MKKLLTTAELEKMTRKKLRDYIMTTLDKVIPSNLAKCELRIIVYCEIGIKQNF